TLSHSRIFFSYIHLSILALRVCYPSYLFFFFFFFNDTATTEIYTLSLHDALPIWNLANSTSGVGIGGKTITFTGTGAAGLSSVTDRKSTRLNSSHVSISYAVFCLKKKKKSKNDIISIVRTSPASTTC